MKLRIVMWWTDASLFCFVFILFFLYFGYAMHEQNGDCLWPAILQQCLPSWNQENRTLASKLLLISINTDN